MEARRGGGLELGVARQEDSTGALSVQQPRLELSAQRSGLYPSVTVREVIPRHDVVKPQSVHFLSIGGAQPLIIILRGRDETRRAN